jgi:hypothetical protein
MRDLTVMLPNRPGALAGVASTLGKAGVNIEGYCAFVVAGGGIANVLVQDAAAARAALAGSDYEVRIEQDVLVVDVEDRPGSLGEITRKVADAGVNLSFAYMATNTRLVLGAEDVEKARAAL